MLKVSRQEVLLDISHRFLVWNFAGQGIAMAACSTEVVIAVAEAAEQPEAIGIQGICDSRIRPFELQHDLQVMVFGACGGSLSCISYCLLVG